ncbi:MAG: DUF2802 domain-containing protein [Methylomonas sp.]
MIRLWKAVKNLKRDHSLLADQLRRQNDDIAGLCSAALAIDQHLYRSDTQMHTFNSTLNEMQEFLVRAHAEQQRAASVYSNEQEAAPKPAENYDNVIAKIRNGAGIDELMKECGLTRDEAVLLSRLHGGANYGNK